MQIVDAVAVTHTGRKRRVNEDGLLQVPGVPLYAVIDGSGGTDAAKIGLDVLRSNTRMLARKIAAIQNDRKSETRLELGEVFNRVFHEAGRKIAAFSADNDGPDVSAAMLTATVVDRFAYFAHVGNSRAYLLRGDELWQLTTDHTFAVASLSRGDITPEDFERSPFKYTLTQALGPSAHMDVEFAEVWLQPGDILMMCTDGLTKVVDDQQICEILASASSKEASRSLIQAALAAGGPDNVSVVVIDIEADEQQSTTSTADIAETLREVFLFKELTEPDRMMIAPYLEEVFYESGEAICTEGELGDSFFVVIEGEVKVTRKTTYLTTIGEGGNFGELALIGSGRRTASVTATKHTRLFQLSRERFMQLIKGKPSMASRLMMPLVVRVSTRLNDVTERLANLEESLGVGTGNL